MRIGIIGGGFMGEAFLRGILLAKIASASEITVAEISSARKTLLSSHNVSITEDPSAAVLDADLVLLAVKPEDITDVAESLRETIPKNAVLVSIAAGVSLSELESTSGHAACVRVMPNLPVAIGEGAAVYLASDAVTNAQLDIVKRLLSAVTAAVVEVFDDEDVDLATALHASGPAYVYMVIESMIDSAVRLGMKRPDAMRLVLATVAGAARYAIETDRHPAELRNAVTSPGGTTAAAIGELEAAGLRAAFDDAIEAAFMRARELGES